MKRNITVNIFGSLYPMDEDAYAMLNAYIANMRDYFSCQPDGKEIADDIEGRVAELMSELRQNGTEAISIEHIEDIINRVGKPEQLIEDEFESISQDVPPIPTANPKKKLFRDPEHKFLGGVFAGFGCYLGVNPLWLRLAYILIIFGFFVNMPHTLPIILLLIATYFVCWGSIPLAANPAERLQMKGEQVNLSNMCDEFLTSTREMLTRQKELNKDGRLTARLASVLKWCVYAIGILFITACIASVIGILIALVCALSAPWDSLREMVGEDFPIVVLLDTNPTWLLWTAAVSITILLGMTLYLLTHFSMRILGRIRPLSTLLRTACLLIWLVALIFSAASITKISSYTNIHYYKKHRADRVRYFNEEKKNRKEKQLEQLIEAGWVLGRRETNINKFTNKGQHFSGNKDISYLEAEIEEAGLGMEYEVVRKQIIAPGIYRLEAKGRTNGQGAEIFATNGKHERFSAAIPVCGNKGGSVWNNARIALEADTAKTLPNRSHLNGMAKVNESKGYGWSDIAVDNITVGPDSILWYGVTNMSPTQTWDGTWLSATSFELKRMDR